MRKQKIPRSAALLRRCLGVCCLVAAVIALPILLLHLTPPHVQQAPQTRAQRRPAAPLVPSSPGGNAVALNLAPHPTVAATPKPRAVSTRPPTMTLPATSGSFAMLPPGSPLPGEAACAASVRRSSFEPRPANAAANHRVPSAQQLSGLNPAQNPYTAQISGNFTGTTDEILQWAACKWGMDVDIVRAQAVVESYWVQGTQGGATTQQSICAPGTWNGKNCYQYFGLLQLTYQYWKSAWPMMRDDTAFGVEYVYALIRNCYQGRAGYTHAAVAGYPDYRAGDIWGCIGAWYSGAWYTQGSLQYIASVKTQLNNTPWLKPNF
jgi:hypothetical protein